MLFESVSLGCSANCDMQDTQVQYVMHSQQVLLSTNFRKVDYGDLLMSSCVSVGMTLQYHAISDQISRAHTGVSKHQLLLGPHAFHAFLT